MTFQQFVQTGLPALGAVVAIAWFLWQRYIALERRFLELERRLVELDHRGQTTRQAYQSNHDMHELHINGLRELIEHRTKRFFGELKAAEARLSKDINEVKGFLDRTTEFKIRDR